MIKGIGGFVSKLMTGILVRVLWGFVIMGIFSAIVLVIRKLLGKWEFLLSLFFVIKTCSIMK